MEELLAAAQDIAVACGFAELVANHAPIVCLLIRRSLDEPLNSWAITRLPGTVFLDHVGDPTLLARDIVHEAGHNWLNDALTATGTDLADGNAYYSPWKNTPRPTFGFLHSCWAFPLTMVLAARAADTARADVQSILAGYLAQHRDKLTATTADHHRALAAVGDDRLRDRLEAVHTMARETGTDPNPPSGRVGSIGP